MEEVESLRLSYGSLTISLFVSSMNLTSSVYFQLVAHMCPSLPASLHLSAPLTPSISLCVSQSLHLYQDFLYFSTLLFLRSESCFSNNSSHSFLPAFVAAAVLKQVLDAIWSASVFCQMVSALLCVRERQR